MKIISYVCDRCGGEEVSHSLSTYYQGSSSDNFGVRHMCKECNTDFAEHFKDFFTFMQNKLEEANNLTKK